MSNERPKAHPKVVELALTCRQLVDDPSVLQRIPQRNLPWRPGSQLVIDGVSAGRNRTRSPCRE